MHQYHWAIGVVGITVTCILLDLANLFAMWPALSFVLALMVIYLLVRLAGQQRGATQPIVQPIFAGSETHAIVLLNDDGNTMETIVNALTGTLNLPEKKAMNLMLRTHREGLAIIWSGSEQEAEIYTTDILQQSHLNFTLRQEPG